jgi:hypothetical protein
MSDEAAARTEHPDFANLDQLSTEELRERAFQRARDRRDLRFFWSVLRHLPHADEPEGDASLGAYGASVDEAVALWREFTGRNGLGENEPVLRAAFIDYLSKD